MRVAIADIPPGMSYETQAANAHLIAAAPDLFAALNGVLAFYAAKTDDLAWVAEARAALSKARGVSDEEES